MRDRTAALKSYAETYSLSSIDVDTIEGEENQNSSLDISTSFTFRALDDANRELTIRKHDVGTVGYFPIHFHGMDAFCYRRRRRRFRSRKR